MKKTIKLLAASLVIALFTAMFFATDTVAATSQNVLNIERDGVSNVANLDFENYPKGSASFGASVTNDKVVYGWTPNLRKTDGESKNISIRQQTGLDGISTNNYMSHRRIPGSIHSRGTYADLMLGKASSKSHSITDFSYIVFDFDICSDEYTYMLDGKAGHGAEVPEGATDVSLAYAAANIYLITRNATNGTAQKPSNLNIVKSGNDWYLDISSKRAKLSDIAGAWNHVTMAICINKNAPQPSATMRYYLNGEYITESSFADKAIYIDCIRFNMSSSCYTETSPYFSIGYDNLAANYYDKSYSSGDDVYGIDDYFSDQNHKAKNLSVCEDIVYVENYSYRGSPTPFLVSLKHKDSEIPEIFYAIKPALAAVKDGDIVTLESNLPSPFVPKHEGEGAIKLLTFKLGKNVGFSLSDESKNYYKIQVTDNTVTLKYDVENALDLLWYDSEGADREVVLAQKLLPMYAPNSSHTKLKIHGKTDVLTNKVNPTIDILLGWDFDLNGDGFGDNKKLSALTMADFLELRESGFTSISIVPKYETVSLAFSIQYVDESGNMKFYAPKYDFRKMSSLDNLFEAIENIETDKEIIVTLYSDLTVDAAKSIKVPAGKNLAIDLNGHTVTQAQKTESTVGVFTVNEASTLSVFSSRAGGKIETTGTGYGVFTADNIDSAKINLGARYDKDGYVSVPGKNLSILCGSIFNFKGSANDSSNSFKITVKINGGSYIGKVSSVKGALIPITELDIALTVNNATLATTTGEPVFAVDTGVAHSAKIDILGSTLAALTADGIVRNLVGVWSDKEQINFVNSTVLGLDLTKKNITLGEDCKLHTTVTVTKDELNLLEGVDVTFVEGPAAEEIVIDTKKVNVEFTVLTFKKDAEVTK